MSVVLNWNDSTEPDLAGYNVYRKAEGGAYGARLNGALLPTSGYEDATRAAGTSVVYGVSAVDTTGNESARAEVAVRSVGATEAGASNDSAVAGRRIVWTLGQGGFNSASDEPIFPHLDTPYGSLPGGFDSTAPTDSAVLAARRAVASTETGAPADSAAVELTVAPEVVEATETAAATDAGAARFARRLSPVEAASATDTALRAFLRALASSEQSAPSDAPLLSRLLRLAPAEAGASTDAASILSAAIERVEATDPTEPTDAAAPATVRHTVVSQAEAFAAADELVVAAERRITRTEDAGASDALALSRFLRMAATEATSATDLGVPGVASALAFVDGSAAADVAVVTVALPPEGVGTWDGPVVAVGIVVAGGGVGRVGSAGGAGEVRPARGMATVG